MLVGDVEKRVKELFYERALKNGVEIIEMEVMSDHVHIVIDVSPFKVVANVIRDMKGYVGHHIREEFPKMKSRMPCLWSRSSFISSVGQVSLETVKRYVENQKGV